MLNIFMGYDKNEHEAYQVAYNSIVCRAMKPVLIHPLSIEHLGYLIPPPIHRNSQLWDIESNAPCSTEFARSRFCVPFLQKRGWAVFMDCDIICKADINEIMEHADPKYAVLVVKHEYTPNETHKMNGAIQTSYPRKNWSSVILWNCSHDAHYRLTKERLNRWEGRKLHAFEWLQDNEIGELPKEWNHLVGVSSNADAFDAKILHFTLGGMWLPDWRPTPLDSLWIKERDELQ